MMKKVIIIGCPGSGKSTFARALHEVTHLPVVQLDLLFWNADKTSVTREVFVQRLDEAMGQECWIMDGNFSFTMEKRMAACDTVFFLDYPVDVCLDGVKSRRGQPRPDMPWIETGDTPDYDEFLAFIRSFEKERRPQVMNLLAKYSEKAVYHFTSREQARDFLNEIRNNWEER